MSERTFTRRNVLRAGGAAALAGLAGCSGGVGGVLGGGSATVYGQWTPARDDSGANQSGESMRAMQPSTLDENRHALGDRYTAISTFLNPPVPTLAFGELTTVYTNAGWDTTLYGVEADFEQSAMVSAYQEEAGAESVNSTYEGYELYRVDGTLSSYLVGVADGRIAIAGSGERDRAALNALVDARESGGDTRRADSGGPLASLDSAFGQDSYTEVALGDDVGVQVGETTPTAAALGFSAADGGNDEATIRSGFVLPDTVSDPEAAVQSRVSGDASVGILHYSDADVTTDGEVVLATETRAVADGIGF